MPTELTYSQILVTKMQHHNKLHALDFKNKMKINSQGFTVANDCELLCWRRTWQKEKGLQKSTNNHIPNLTRVVINHHATRTNEIIIVNKVNRTANINFSIFLGNGTSTGNSNFD
jgi:hypothetical protein